MRSVFFDMKVPYGRLEAWLYDAIVAPAVSGFKADLVTRLLAEIPAGGRVLDVGCGGGHLAVRLGTERPDLTVVGVDLNQSQVSRARQRVRSGGGRLSFLRGSALALPFEARSFDMVVSVASIKHWPDPARGVAECRRLVRPGGGLVVIEADRGCRFEDARDFVARWRLPALLRPPALMFFRTFVAGQGLDLDEARALLEPLGLRDARVERLDGTPALALVGRAPDP